MKTGKMPEDDDGFNTTIKPFYPRIDAAAVKAMGLANMNSTVHQVTYNKIIKEAALKLDMGATD